MKPKRWGSPLVKEKYQAKRPVTRDIHIIIIIIRIIIIKEKYINGHGRVCVQVLFNRYKEIGVKLDKEHWYDHVPKFVETDHEYKITML